jgi:ABC transport system ATP-binding/permease protein
VANLHLRDWLLVLAPTARRRFFGPPADGLRHFDQEVLAEVFQAFETQAETGLGSRVSASQ